MNQSSLLIFLLLAHVVGTIHGQEAGVDTFEVDEQLINPGDSLPGEDTMPFESDEKRQLHLAADTKYAQKEFTGALSIFQQLVNNYPDYYPVKLDYGRALFELGQYEEAVFMLTEYLHSDPGNVECLTILGTLAYWDGRFKDAAQYLKQALQIEPDNESVKSMLGDINMIIAPWVKISGRYSSDKQPLRIINNYLEGGWYQSQLFAPTISANLLTFDSEGNRTYQIWLQASNRLMFIKQKVEIDLAAGVVRQPQGKINWTGELSLSKKMLKHLRLKGGVVRTPYTYTTASLLNPMVSNNYQVMAAWEDFSTWSGKTQFSLSQFEDDNYVLNFYSWMLTPPLKLSWFEFRLGYGYNYSDSKENRCTPRLSVDEALDQYLTLTDIEGEYVPYYTPEEQHIHSAIGSMVFKPADKFKISASANVGFYAYAMHPYFYLDSASDGEVFFTREFYKENYMPIEASASMGLSLSRYASLEASYHYLRTYYFDEHLIGLDLKIHFADEQGR